jgi:DNA-binding transcriptional LysR family regulator
MNSERLRTFHRVARIGSFRRAAEDLHLSQPAVSKQIRALEAELGAQLFERGHVVTLTPAGEALVGYAERVDSLMRAAHDELGDLARVDAGQLRVGLSHTASLHVVPRTVARFRSQFPRVGLYLETNWASDLARQVSRHELDLAIAGFLEPSHVVTADLECRVLATSDAVFATSAASPLVSTPRVALRDALALPWVVNHAGCQFRAYLEDLFREHGGALKASAEIVGIDLQRRLVQLGLGAGLFAAHAVAEDLASGALVPFQVASLRPRVRLCLLYRKAKYVHHAMRNFLTLLEEDAVLLDSPAAAPVRDPKSAERGEKTATRAGARRPQTASTRKNGRGAARASLAMLDVRNARIENTRPSRG